MRPMKFLSLFFLLGIAPALVAMQAPFQNLTSLRKTVREKVNLSPEQLKREEIRLSDLEKTLETAELTSFAKSFNESALLDCLEWPEVVREVRKITELNFILMEDQDFYAYLKTHKDKECLTFKQGLFEIYNALYKRAQILNKPSASRSNADHNRKVGLENSLFKMIKNFVIFYKDMAEEYFEKHVGGLAADEYDKVITAEDQTTKAYADYEEMQKQPDQFQALLDALWKNKKAKKKSLKRHEFEKRDQEALAIKAKIEKHPTIVAEAKVQHLAFVKKAEEAYSDFIKALALLVKRFDYASQNDATRQLGIRSHFGEDLILAIFKKLNGSEEARQLLNEALETFRQEQDINPCLYQAMLVTIQTYVIKSYNKIQLHTLKGHEWEVAVSLWLYKALKDKAGTDNSDEYAIEGINRHYAHPNKQLFSREFDIATRNWLFECKCFSGNWDNLDRNYANKLEQQFLDQYAIAQALNRLFFIISSGEISRNWKNWLYNKGIGYIDPVAKLSLKTSNGPIDVHSLYA
jgi:hypothetical protein